MATGRRKIEEKTVEVVRQETKMITEVILTLSIAEAYALVAVTARVGGPPEGRRGQIGAISKALQQANVYDTTQDSDYHEGMNIIQFRR